MGTAIPDTVHVATDGLVIGIKTPRYEGFGARAVYVGGLQGNVPQGPLNPARPWDSYAAGKFLEASYHVRHGVTVGVYGGDEHNAYATSTTGTITETRTSGRVLGVTVTDRF